LRSPPWNTITVELGDLVRAGELVRQLIDDRGEDLAGPAPGGGEVDQHRLIGLEHFCVEIEVVDGNHVLAGHGFWSPEGTM